MKPLAKRKVFVWGAVICGLFLFLNITGLTSQDMGEGLLDNFDVFEPFEPLLPPDVTVEPGFMDGPGKPIGTVQKIQGKVYVIHQGESEAYMLKADSPLFTEDTIVTGDRSRVYAIMNDESAIAVAPKAKMVLVKSVYDPNKEKRSTVMGLLWGSARFIVKKLKGGPNYEIRTPTAVCGLRGTDLAVSVAPANKAERKSNLEGIEKYLSEYSPVREANAFVIPGAMITTVVTGSGSTVALAGGVGAATVVGPFAVAGAATGAAATGATVVGAAAAGAALSAVGPALGTLGMPPEFD